MDWETYFNNQSIEAHTEREAARASKKQRDREARELCEEDKRAWQAYGKYNDGY